MRPFDLTLIGETWWKASSLPGMAEGQTSDFVDASRFPDWVARYRVQMQYKGFGHSLWSSRVFRRGLDTDTIYARVAAAKIPVLLVWGEKDKTNHRKPTKTKKQPPAKTKKSGVDRVDHRRFPRAHELAEAVHRALC